MPLPFRPLQTGDTKSPRAMETYLHELERVVGNLYDQVESLKRSLGAATAAKSDGSGEVVIPRQRLTAEDLQIIKRALESGGSAELDLTDMLGIGAEPADVRFPILTTAPDPVIAAYDAYILKTGSNYVLYQIDRSVNPPVPIAITSSATPHEILSAQHSDSLVGTVVRGDVIVGNATPKWARLAKGTANQVMRMDGAGTDPGWGAVADAALSANVALLTGNQTFSGDKKFDGLVDVSGELWMSGAVVIDNTSSPYTIPSGVSLVAVNTSGGAVTVKLPATVPLYRVFIIFDATGNAAANNLTLDGNTHNINGAASIVLATA